MPIGNFRCRHRKRHIPTRYEFFEAFFEFSVKNWPDLKFFTSSEHPHETKIFDRSFGGIGIGIGEFRRVPVFWAANSKSAWKTGPGKHFSRSFREMTRMWSVPFVYTSETASESAFSEEISPIRPDFRNQREKLHNIRITYVYVALQCMWTITAPFF